jgi:GAF domain-containing protein
VDSAAALSELVGLLLTTDSVEDFLQQLAELAAQATPGGTACGITLHRDGQPMTVGSSNDLARDLDEVQYGEQHGPCLQALTTGTIVSVPDTRTDTRWVGYPAYAGSRGVRSSMSLPLVVEGVATGAMNVYAADPNAFGEVEQDRLQALAGQASAALTLVLRQAHQALLSRQLSSALSARRSIDRAIGVLMDQRGCTADEAFAAWRKRSQHTNRKVRDRATEVVAGTARPSGGAARGSADKGQTEGLATA